MKVFSTLFIITFVIIDGKQGAPAIHPIHVQTIPLHPVTPSQPTGSSERHSSDVTQFTELTSPQSSLSSTTPHHSSWWNNRNSAGQIFLRILLYVFIAALLGKFLERVCKSKKQEKLSKKKCPVVVKNKMYVSTIDDGQREEPPPAYVEIHNLKE